MSKAISFLLFMIFISGCAEHAANYNPTNLPTNQLATIRPEDVSSYPFNYVRRATILKAYDSNGNQIASTIPLIGGYDLITLPEGKYLFEVMCETRNVYNHHKIKLEAKSGEAYTAYCLGHYEEKERLLGKDNALTLMLGFISNNRDLNNSMAANQKLVDEIAQLQ